MSRTLDTRIQNKCDTAANWNNKPDFVPLRGELIIYTDYEVNNEKTVAIKYGDGTTKLRPLPFVALGTSGESAGKLDSINVHYHTSTGEYKWYDPEDTDDAKWLGTIVIRTDTQVEVDLSIDKVLKQESAVVVVHYQGQRNQYATTIYSDTTRTQPDGHYYFYAYTDKGVYSDVIHWAANGTTTTYIDPPQIKTDLAIYYNGNEYDICNYITNWNDIKDLVTVSNNNKTAAGNYITTFTLKSSTMKWTSTNLNTCTLTWAIKPAQVERFIVEQFIAESGEWESVGSPLTIPYKETVQFRYRPEFKHDTTLVFGESILKPYIYLTTKEGAYTAVTVVKIKDGYAYFNLNITSNYELYFSVNPTGNNIPGVGATFECNVQKKTLEDYTWAEISEISRSGNAQDYFSIGDMKKVYLNGSISMGEWGTSFTLDIDEELYVYIVHFDVYNQIYFQGFKRQDPDDPDKYIDVCINKVINVEGRNYEFFLPLTHWNSSSSGTLPKFGVEVWLPQLNDLFQSVNGEEGPVNYMKDITQMYLDVSISEDSPYSSRGITSKLQLPSEEGFNNWEYYKAANPKTKYSSTETEVISRMGLSTHDYSNDEGWRENPWSGEPEYYNRYFVTYYYFEDKLKQVNNLAVSLHAHKVGIAPYFVI